VAGTGVRVKAGWGAADGLTVGSAASPHSCVPVVLMFGKFLAVCTVHMVTVPSSDFESGSAESPPCGNSQNKGLGCRLCIFCVWVKA
jgi:hypothetical protein